VTCGADGDVRVWLDPEDQDPVVFSASDTCLSIHCFGDKAYVGAESNQVEVYSLPNGKSLGSVAKFTAAVNHVDVSKSGKILVAGSG
jgi:chromosome transmission fidelity protein 4